MQLENGTLPHLRVGRTVSGNIIIQQAFDPDGVERVIVSPVAVPGLIEALEKARKEWT